MIQTMEMEESPWKVKNLLIFFIYVKPHSLCQPQAIHECPKKNSETFRHLRV